MVQAIKFRPPTPLPSGITFGWVDTNASIPNGGSRVTALDGRFPRQVATSGTNPGATGGAATHLHAFSQHNAHVYQGHGHSGTWGDSANSSPVTLNDTGQTPIVFTANVHHHSSAGDNATDIGVQNNSAINTDTFANDPLHVTTIFVQSSGSMVGVPRLGVVWVNGAAPTGWSQYTALDDRLMKGAATGADGGTQAGANSHSHTVATHTHTVNTHVHFVRLNGDGASIQMNSGGAAASPTHTHTIGNSGTESVTITAGSTAENTGTGDLSPQWKKLRAIQNISSNGIFIGMICMWTGTLASIPVRWHLCDGTGGTPDMCTNRFTMALGTGSLLDLGGAQTHTHAAGTAHSHTSSGTHTHTVTAVSSAGTGQTLPLGGAVAATDLENHTHGSTTYTSSSVAGIGTSTTQATTQNANSTDSAYPLWTGVAYIQFMGG